MVTNPSFRHNSLNATLRPAEREHHYEFRGIKYASISARWEHSQAIDNWDGQELDCTEYGPKCPQPYRDIAAFYSLPADQKLTPDITQDEFQCLNLVVSSPKSVMHDKNAKVPVLIFIHGGAHAITMVNIEQGFTDPSDLIKQSLEMQKPIVVVHMAYRLHLFGFAVHQGKTNFAIHDQKRAVEWVQKHISGFGGDPSNICLSGESSGALDVHAHIHGPLAIRGIKRAILQSGSMYMTDPAPQSVGVTVMKRLASLYGKDVNDLRTVSSEDIIKGVAKLGIRTFWLHHEPETMLPSQNPPGWPISDSSDLESIMIGDCQYESRGFEATIMSHGMDKLKSYFDSRYRNVGAVIASLYNIDFSSGAAARSALSAFINDIRFAYPVHKMFTDEHKLGKRRCYRYVMDQRNPWNPAVGPQHAIDLLFLYGGPYDYSHDEEAMRVSVSIRQRWIAFLYGEDPWPEDQIYAFGPAGECKVIGDEELTNRRRVSKLKTLDVTGWKASLENRTNLVTFWREGAAPGRIQTYDLSSEG
ncbi:hypothetical protein NM208_g13883 [Fusarium decemcellulare]|uniref:Uncharacterized protein n=1 Tax=Fusarium decemcellulare TaxID=57161 RepID=A0ACC1RI39_9HYPO|nr:hypothetical protein NM208_g13883 [Fusarium decemcellulare]